MNIASHLRPIASVRSVFPRVAVFFFYLGIAIVITWPLATVLGTHFAGFPDSDAFEMARHIWWFKHTLQTGQPIFYQTSLGYPDGIDGSVLMWANPLQWFPAWLFAFVMPLPAAFNLSALLTMALNGWAMHRLAHDLTGGRRGAALLAGVVFMAAPTFQGHLAGGHGGLMVMWPVPLFLRALFRLRDRMDRRRVVAGALFLFFSPGGHLLQALYVLMPIVALFIVARVIRREWAWLARALLALALGGVVLMIYQIPAARVTLGVTAYEDEGGFVRYSADLLAVVTPSFFHPVFGSLDYTARVLGINIVEGHSYIGLAAGLLALVAVWKQPQSRWWLAVGIAAWILSLGPLLKLFDQPVVITTGGYETYITLPWAAVQNLPILNLARTPARFNFVMPLALATMAGYGAAALFEPRRRMDIQRTDKGIPLEASWLDGNRSRQPASSRLPAGGGKTRISLRVNRAVILVLTIAFILWEYQSFWPFPTTPAVIPDAVTALAARDDIRAIFDLPWNNLLAAKEALYLQTGHQRALIAGQITRRTPVSPAKLSLLESTLDPALLDAAGVDIIILHKTYDYDGSLGGFARAQLGEPFYEDERFALFEALDSDGEPQFTALVTPVETISRQADSYLYAPEPGWVQISGQFTGSGRTVQLLVDNQPLRSWTIDGDLPFSLPVPISNAGYHTMTLALRPPCPQHHPPTLECDGVRVSDLSMDVFTPAALDTPLLFERGVQLAGAHIQQTGETISVGLWWRFDQPRSEFDVRFVHLLDAEGKLVAQADGTLGEQPAGSQWVDTAAIPIPDNLDAGTYHVYAGWYTYPDTVRFAVLSDAPGAENGLAFLGTLEVTDSP